jgi:hypothetical protein
MFFHFSRILGNGGFVVPATYREVARPELKKWIKKAFEYIDRTKVETTINAWGILKRRHARNKEKRKPDIVIGSLAKNPRGEETHSAFKYIKGEQILRPEQYRKTKYYKLVAGKKPISDVVELDPSKPKQYWKNVQLLAYAEDFVAMVLIDHLFNERDRAGNIHQKTWVHWSEDGNVRWAKDGDKATGVQMPLLRLLLKDNDDGMRWDVVGKLRMTPLVGDLRHMDKLVYDRMQWLAGLMRDPATEPAVHDFFVESVRVPEKGYQDVKKRFLRLAGKFEKKYQEGDLMLDLDLAAAIAGAPALPEDDKKKKKKRRKKKRD